MGCVRKKFMNFAKFINFFLLFCSAHGPQGRTLRKTKGIFSKAHVLGKNIEF